MFHLIKWSQRINIRLKKLMSSVENEVRLPNCFSIMSKHSKVGVQWSPHDLWSSHVYKVASWYLFRGSFQNSRQARPSFLGGSPLRFYLCLIIPNCTQNNKLQIEEIFIWEQNERNKVLCLVVPISLPSFISNMTLGGFITFLSRCVTGFYRKAKLS